MCGICGIYHQQSGYASPEQLGAMLDSIYHRGPDEDGQFATADGRLAMGMRRLSIIDLAGGTQPIYNEDQTIAIVFNGEIYNHQDLRRDLEAKGHRFRTNSDTEAIVHLYEEYGVDCVKRLRGMFGFSIWDSNQDRLLIARDHLGIKPIYYTRHNGQLIYSSEIKAILHHLPERPSVNLEALSDFLSLRYVPAPNTLFNDIYALLPGHRMIGTPDDIHIESYWDVDMREPSPDETRSEASYLEELGALLQESVKMRLMSDVPFGAFLSGGVDSSTVVALMSQYLSNPVKTFSVGFEGAHGEKAFSELPYARQVAEHYQTDHHDVLVSADDTTLFPLA
ncbi:MAG: asparagine synthase (glutamine-hydrolyzing) [Chloroflexota bacterium]